MIKDVNVGAIEEVVDRALASPCQGDWGFFALDVLSMFFVPFMVEAEHTRDELILQGMVYGIVYDNLAIWITDVPNGKRVSTRGVLFDDEQLAFEFAKRMRLKNYFNIGAGIRNILVWKG